MAPANNSLRASIPSLADVERRRRELFAWQAAHRAPAAGSPTASSDDASDDEDPALEEVNRLGEYLESLQALENLQQNEVPESPGEPYPAEYPSSSPTAPEPPWPRRTGSLRPRGPSSCNSSPPSATSSAQLLTAPSVVPVTAWTSS